jgi:hypothetical protein
MKKFLDYLLCFIAIIIIFGLVIVIGILALFTIMCIITGYFIKAIPSLLILFILFVLITEVFYVS